MSKKLIPIKIKLRVWDGTLDHSWYTNSVDGIAHISTPEQFADFITPTSSRSGITEVHLDNDLYFNEKYFENKTWNVDTQNKSIISTVGDTSRQKFVIDRNLTFYGNFHSIYGFSFKSTSNLENHFIYMEGINYNLTFKDLYWRNCYFTEAGGAGIFMGVDRESTKFIIMENVGFIDTYFDYRTIRSSSSSYAWKNSITTMSTKMNVVFKGCKLNNVQCISQKGLDLTSMPTSYELNVSMVDCDSTPTFFSVFNNPTTTGKHVYNNYNNTNIQNNKSSYNECVESFNSYESTSLSLIDLDDNFNYEGTPSPTDEYIEESVVIKSPKYWDGSFDDNSWESTLVQDGANYQYFISTPSQFMNFLYNIPVKSTSSTFHIYCYITDDLYFNKDYLNNKSWGYLESGINNQIKSWSDSGVPRFTSTYGQLYIDGISYSSTNRPCKLVGLYSCLPNKGVDRHYNAFMVVGNSWNSGGTSAYGIAYKGLEFDNCTFGIGNQGTIGEWTLASNDVYRRFYGLTFNSCKFEIFNGSSSYWNGLGLLNFESKSNTPAHYLFKNVIMKDCDYKSNASMKMVGFFAQQLTQSTGTLNMDEFEDFSNNYIENCKYIGSFTKFNKFGCFSANYSTPSSMSNNYYDSGCTIDNYTFGNQMLGNLDSHNNDAEKTIDFLNVNALVEKFDYKGKEYYSFELDGENKSLLPNDSDSPIHYQSKTEVEDPTPDYYDGSSVDYSWYNSSSIDLYINSCAALVGARNISRGSASGITTDNFHGKTLHLTKDLVFNKNYENYRDWVSNRNGINVNALDNGIVLLGTFDGGFHSIYGYCSYKTGQWDFTGIFESKYNSSYRPKIKNLTISNFTMQSCYVAPIDSPNIDIENVIIKNAYIYRYRGGYNEQIVGTLLSAYPDNTNGSITCKNCIVYNVEASMSNKDSKEKFGPFVSVWTHNTDRVNVTLDNCYASNVTSSNLSSSSNIYTLTFGNPINVTNSGYYNVTSNYEPTSQGEIFINDESIIESYNDRCDERVIDGYVFENNKPYNPSKYEKVEITKIPEGSDFLWLASNYNTSNKSIKNDINESTMFDTLYDKGSLTKNGFGENCYLSGTSNSNYLYRNLDTNELNICKSNSSGQCFTYIIKASSDPNQIGGLLSFRNNGNMNVYCIRTYGGKIFYTYTNYNTTDSSIDFIDENIYMFVIKPTTTIIRNLTNGFSKTITTSTSRSLTSNFRIMNAGYNGENGITKFFGCYGASKELNEQEVESVKRILDTQKIYKWYKLGDQKLLLINPKTLEGV